MLGKTANGIFWMFRQIERSENITRLLDAGLRMALTRRHGPEDEWKSVLATAGGKDDFLAGRDQAFRGEDVLEFLLRDRNNPSSVLSLIEAARTNARLVRTALTREVWEATNECWMTTCRVLRDPIREEDLPPVLEEIRNRSALIRGALHGTLLRNEIFSFARLGTFLERADSTARILDVKYYLLLPSVSLVGSSLDSLQWESILRSVSALRAYRWEYHAELSPAHIAEFLVLNRRMPRSLTFCYERMNKHLAHLEEDHAARHLCHDLAKEILERLNRHTAESIVESGLHEFILSTIADNNRLASEVQAAYRFTE